MGLNGKPAEVVLLKLKKAKNPFGINIAKTHNPDIIGERAIEDISNTYKLSKIMLKEKENLMYVVLNLSCPNTAEGKTFEDPSAFQD